MSHKGVGARIAWSIESKRVLKELLRLLGGREIQLEEFAEGERHRQAALASHAFAREQRGLKTASFVDRNSFAEAVQQSLRRWNPADRLILFLQDSERKGVYVLKQVELMDSALQLLIHDGSCIYFTSADGSQGALLDIEQDRGVPAVFQLEEW